MQWHKVTFLYKDCGIGTKDTQMQSAFTVLLVAQGGRPWTAALFSQRSEDFEYVFYYFSPDAADMAGGLLRQYKAVPCERPPKPSIASDGVHLSSGDVRSVELLWPK